MTRQLALWLFPTAAIIAAAGPATAQYPYPYPNTAYGQGRSGSPLSPYLNLQSGRGLPGVNYYNFVRPNLQMQQQQTYGGGAIGGVDPYSLASDVNAAWTQAYPRPTGNLNGPPAAFMNYGGYFNSMGSVGLGVSRAGQPAAGGRAPSVPIR
jgi:hypothetical protein